MTPIVRPSIGLILVFAAAGCGGSTDPGTGSNNIPNGSNSGNSTTAQPLEIAPTQIYTGFDGANTYKAPIATQGGTHVTWSLSDPSAGDLAPTPDGTQLMITTKKAGRFTLTAMSGTMTATATLIVQAYTPMQHDIGKHRYTNTEGGDPACNSCHGGAAGIDHTPTQTVFDNDTAVLNTFLTGKNPEGKMVMTAKHNWTVTEAEKSGLVAYIRSLEPKGYPNPEDPAGEGL